MGSLQFAMSVHKRSIIASLRGLLYYKYRHFSMSNELKYIEIEQLKHIKSNEFYDRYNATRRYFYYIDLQGRLFLENTQPKNIATSLKSEKFLRFFFSQLRPTSQEDRCALHALDHELLPSNSPSMMHLRPAFLDYLYQSPCGREHNYIKCADSPYVFESLEKSQGINQTDENEGNWILIYGCGTQKTMFNPKELKVCQSTGRLYHTFYPRKNQLEFGLIRSQLGIQLSEWIHLHEDIENNHMATFKWQGMEYPIKMIKEQN